jgi:hypothetical protein
MGQASTVHGLHWAADEEERTMRQVLHGFVGASFAGAAILCASCLASGRTSGGLGDDLDAPGTDAGRGGGGEATCPDPDLPCPPDGGGSTDGFDGGGGGYDGFDAATPAPGTDAGGGAGCPDCCVAGDLGPCTTACGSAGTRTCEAPGTWGSCGPPPEVCGNGADDDCDGVADEDCVFTCEDADGNNCNDDLGYGDACDAADNVNGCSAERFWAWCNRRNDLYPGIWDDYVQGWVDDRCDGAVTGDGSQYETFSCVDSSGVTWSCTTPLVLVFDADGDAPVVFEPRTAAAAPFALEPAAPDATSDWPAAATPWLCLDRDGSGTIDGGAELFGAATPLGRGGRAAHGFEALAELDDDGDGWIDAWDAAWPELLLWRDADGDRASGAAELQSVAAAGLVAIGLAWQDRPRCDARGNCERERAVFYWRDAAGRLRRGAVVDVHFTLRAPPG